MTRCRRSAQHVGRRVAASVVVAVVVLSGSGCGGGSGTDAQEVDGPRPTVPSDDGLADDAAAEDSGGDDGSGDGADDPAGGTDGPAEDGAASVDPSIEVPEWVEVVGVEEALNVRAGPAASFERIAQVPPGETLRVLGGVENDEGGLWLQVVFGGDREGWVFSRYTNGIARPTPTPLPTPTPVGTPTPLPVGDGGDAGDGGAGGQVLRVVAPDGLNLRDAPGLDSVVIGELEDGDRLEATGRTRRADGRGWTEVRVGGQTGWVASEFVR